MTTQMLTIAVSKGYMLEKTILLFNDIGLSFDVDLQTSRKLFSTDHINRVRLLQVRPWDVPVYVQGGAADLGIVGKDVLLEKDPPIAELLDLKFGRCDLVLAGMEQIEPNQLAQNLTVATKYPRSTVNYFQDRGLKIELINLYGAIELAPMTGLADVICDLTATGKTLKENNLKIIDTIFRSSARLVANPVSLKVHYDRICAFSENLAKCCKE
ncbi:MAG: ATP phosphoribosyltransferase [Candidatus Margulisbacteria bacterium]|nr:ATP phosphoribosyltransferase [Candidatus Margulisiibacteriota bacterium]